MKNKKIVFLDRDGVINKDSPEYVKGPDEFEFLPRSVAGICLLAKSGFDIIIVTNQSGLARGFFSREDLDLMHGILLDAVWMRGGSIKDIFFCPHLPEHNCECRKPKPGMIIDACKKFGINPSSSIMVGDSVKDIECGINAGAKSVILVKTGNGIMAEKKLARKRIIPDHVTQDLYEAAECIIDDYT